MEILWILLGVLAGICLLCLLTAFICYRMAFYSAPRKPQSGDTIDIPEGDIYEVFREDMERWCSEIRKMPHEDVEITSFDGLTLRGKFYECTPGAPMEVMFHGYRGSGERDLNGGVQRCFRLGRSALIVEQRASGPSDGKTITFGVNEHKDCLAWAEFAQKRYGRKMILTGISMGASTVLMAAGKELPENVVGILADCGYSDQQAIIRKVIRDMKLPDGIAYPFVKLGARLFGGFKLDGYTPIDAVKTAKVPIIFFHGQDDAFVPCQMSRELYDACAAPKKLVEIPEAGHGLSYLVDPETYINELRAFFPDVSN